MDKVIVIVGPTGVGKTKMSVELAKHFNGEIINADSTQVYRGLDIATAKITEDEKEEIHHHLFDFKDITEDYTVYDYQRDCRTKIEEIKNRGKTPILVGGTGLYIKATLYDYEFKEQLVIKNDYTDLSDEELYNMLKGIDPNTEIHPNNRKRIQRALDYFENHNELMPMKKSEKLLYDVIFIGLTTDRKLLYENINKRVDKMVNMGLLEEAKKIYESGVRTKAIMTPIGYKELFPYFDGIKPLEECLNQTRQDSRRYAKRQYTWFNNQMDVVWFDVDFENFNNTVEKVIDYIKQ